MELGCQKCDINHLTHNMLFHKPFNLNEVKIRSTTNCEKYYTKHITKKNGWLELCWIKIFITYGQYKT